MKKVFTLFAAMVLMGSMCFAQTAQRSYAVKTLNKMHRTVKPSASDFAASPKAAGDTIASFPWTEGFDNGTPAGFSFVDNDGDGEGWFVATQSSNNMTPHSGDGLVTSASWTEDGGPLTPDNWMILPSVTLPADAADFTISWYEAGQDANYASEYYSVYVCATGRSVADFTATTAVFSSTSTGSYVKKTVSLANYAGQTVNIAFRHHNCTDMFMLNIDDIRIGGGEAPEVVLAGPTAVELGVEATFTASGASTFSWSVDGTQQSETGATLAYTFTTVGTHSVVASATNNNGTSSDSIVVNVYDCSSAITVMPWEESFESNTECWQFVTLDATSTGFSIYTQTGHTGTNSLLGAYSDDSDVDQWAISPMITLPTDASNFILKYYVLMNEWEGVESEYEVRLATVSDNNISTSDFTTLLFTETGTTEDFAPRTVSLANYAGQTIRIAFRNITAQEGDAMLIDDIYIGAPLLPDLSLDGPEQVRINEPYTFTATSDANSFVWTVDGSTQSATGNELSYTFTTTGTHTIEVSATNNVGTASAEMQVEAIECTTQNMPFTFDLSQEFSLCWDMRGEGWSTIDIESENCMYSMSNLYGIFDLDPDNWIISPSIAMPATGEYEISYKVRAFEPSLPTDHYGVYVISGGQETLLFEETLDASMSTWRSRFVTIPSTVSGDFKVAFRHFNTTGGYVILVTDVKVDVLTEHEGIENADKNSIAVYPNPARDMINVEGEGIVEVQIIDINGRTAISATAGSIDISSLANGIYFVRTIANDGVYTTKIVKR